MSPVKGTRYHGRGTLILDRQFKGLGRLRLASGTTNHKTFKLLDAMLVTLYDKGRLDLLALLQRRVITVGALWDKYRSHDLEALQSAEQLLGLEEAVEAWLKTKVCSEGHRRNLRVAFRTLSALKAGATVADLPDLLRQYRATCEQAETPRVFNQAKAAARAFAKVTLGHRSDVALSIMDVPVLREQRKPGQPQTVGGALAIRDQLGPHHGPIWWAMCCTGMRPGEYWGTWAVEGPEAISVAGTKTAAAARRVPRVDFLARPTRAYRPFRIAISKLGLTPYDARRTYAHWLEEAGVPRTRRRHYLGHATKDVTDLYESHDVGPYLKGDAERLRAYLRAGQRQAETPTDTVAHG